MDPHPFGKDSSSIVPQKITQKGILGNNIWLLGTVVRSRQKLPNEEDAKAKGLPSGKTPPKGKGGKKGKDKAKPASQNYEIHLNGGYTPADVLMIVAWEDAPRKKLEDTGKIGAPIAIHKAYIKEHDATSLKWTTSRHPLYALFGKEAEVRPYTGALNWLTYHPLSKFPSLRYVPTERLVCIAGRVLSPGARSEDVQLEDTGDTVKKTSFYVRAEDKIVQVEAWRDSAGYAQEVQEGGFYFIEGIKRVEKRQENEVRSVVRYQKNTKHSECEATLLKMLQETTPDGWEGATSISPMFSGASGMSSDLLQKIMDGESPWLSLSVVGKIIEGKKRRKLEGSVQIPSVLIKIPDTITYVSCAGCHKGALPQKTCNCTTEATIIRFLGRLRLEDDGSEERATVFDAMKSLVHIYADGEEEKQKPEFFHDQLDHVEDLRLSIEAMPFTLLVTFNDSEYREEIELNVNAIEKTFHVDPTLIRHPRKPILRCIDNLGEKPFCPPCLVEDTAFEEGAGVTKVPGGVSEKFRTLVTIADRPTRVEKDNNDSSPVVRCTRRVQCCLSNKETDPFYTLAVEGPINVANRLLLPRKGEVISALVTWRSAKELTLLSYAPAMEKGAELDAFKKFFLEEVNFYKGESKSISLAIDSTPTKRQFEATKASKMLATPEPWSKRNRKEADAQSTT